LVYRVFFLAAERPASSFQFLSAPHAKHGPPGDLLGVLGHAARSAARLIGKLERQGRSRAKRIGGVFAAAPASAASAAAASAAVTSAVLAAASVWAVKISARLVERASGTRSRSCVSPRLHGCAGRLGTAAKRRLKRQQWQRRLLRRRRHPGRTVAPRRWGRRAAAAGLQWRRLGSEARRAGSRPSGMGFGRW
jgi:hypothetical protein